MYAIRSYYDTDDDRDDSCDQQGYQHAQWRLFNAGLCLSSRALAEKGLVGDRGKISDVQYGGGDQDQENPHLV